MVFSKKATDCDSECAVNGDTDSSDAASSVHVGLEDGVSEQQKANNGSHVKKKEEINPKSRNIKKEIDRKRRNIVIAIAVLIALLAALIVVVLLVLKPNGGGGHTPNSKATNAADEKIDGTAEPSIPGTHAPTELPSALPTGMPSLSPTMIPTEMPSLFPTDEPTTATPSLSPSSFPTGNPTTSFPSQSPTLAPTENPTTSFPSQSPTLAPTFYTIPANSVPENPPRGYFNYDLNDERYGPKAWSRVDTSNHFTLREFGPRGFGTWKNSLQVDPTENRCKWDDGSWQSPKNLVQNDGVIIPGDGNDGQCDSHHEIRTRCGSFSIDSDRYKEVILPHKLSVVMNRRECRNINDDRCTQGSPPMTDYPKYSPTGGGWSDLLNFDIKVPGEHTIAGEVFDAEIQMLHAHLDNEKLNSLGIPVRAVNGPPNDDFQKILNQFHLVHYEDLGDCLRRRNLRQKEDIFDYYKDLMEEGVRDGWYNNHTAQMTNPEFIRELQAPAAIRFDPYSYDLMPDMFFFRYWGSMTEPPCMFLTWWVMDKPMIISFDQLSQVKFLLFTHVDSETCERTSVHNAQQSVARPIQPIGPKKTSFIQHCKTGKWRSDFERFGYQGRRCN